MLCATPPPPGPNRAGAVAARGIRPSVAPRPAYGMSSVPPVGRPPGRSQLAGREVEGERRAADPQGRTDPLPEGHPGLPPADRVIQPGDGRVVSLPDRAE